jgi:transcriptional regulator with XRE-family HTH domain
MIGPVGRQAIANIEELRQSRGLSLRDLAARLAALGRPIGDTVLHRQSQGKRRIDADDLLALTVALGVNANAILLDRHAAAGDVIDLTPAFRQRADVVWDWAAGRQPLPAQLVDDSGIVRRTLAEEVDFSTHARPDLDRLRGHPAILAAEQFIAAVLTVLRTAPDLDEKQRENVNRALQRVSLEVAEMFAAERGQADG